MALIKNLPEKTNSDIADTDIVIIEDDTNTCKATMSSIKSYLTNTLPSYLLDKIYPIGSIYMSVNNISPSDFLGGVESHRGLGFNCLCQI